MKPSIALDEMDSLERWMEGPRGDRFVHQVQTDDIGLGIIRSSAGGALHERVPGAGDETDQLFWHDGILISVTKGEPYFWSKPMAELLAAAVDGLPDWRFDPTLLPSNYGYIWFDQPLPMPDLLIKDATVAIPLPLRAMVYGRMAPPNPVLDEPSYWAFWGLCINAMEPRPGGLPTNMVLWREGETLAEVEQRINLAHEREPELSPTFSQEAIDASRLRSLAMLKYIAASILLMNQKVFRVAKEPAERATRRRVRRLQPVNVLSLRRTKYSVREGDPSPVDWAWRWFVSGHWRRIEGRNPIRIFPYLKGPEGRPLKPTVDRLFKVVR